MNTEEEGLIWMRSPRHLHPWQLVSAGILEQSTGARNRVGIGLSNRTAMLHMLAELIHWNRFLGSIKV
jgi:hypothetical protein